MLFRSIGRNVLNVGIFLVEVLFLILAGPALLKFFMPVVLGWLIACIANPLVKFLEKRLHIVRKHSSFVVILGAILLIVLGCYYGITALFYEGAKIVERFPAYYATLLDSLNHLGDLVINNILGYIGRSTIDSKILDYRCYGFPFGLKSACK